MGGEIMKGALQMTLKHDEYGQSYLVEDGCGCVCVECGKIFDGEGAVVVDTILGDVMCPLCRENLLKRFLKIVDQLSESEKQVLFLIASDEPATIFG